MLFKIIKKSHLLKTIVYSLSKNRAIDVVSKIEPLICKGDRILDIGSGTCNVAEILVKNRHKVQTIDISDKSIVKGLTPIVYDGELLPFESETFDLVLLLDVLHHCSNPIAVLQAARKVGKKIVIMESLYSNNFQKLITQVVDVIVNLEFFNHPMNHLSDSLWRKIFASLNLKVVKAEYYKFWGVLFGATYFIRSDGG